MDLVLDIYKLTASFPKTEVYGLASQMQRTAVSIPSNIAEGHGLKQTRAYARHLAIANGSLTELETQLEIANRLGYLTARRTDRLFNKPARWGGCWPVCGRACDPDPTPDS